MRRRNPFASSASILSLGEGSWLSLFFENFLVEISHALFLSANVEGAIAADREKPFGGSEIQLPALASLQLDECFLNYVTGPVAIAQNPRGVLQERQLERRRRNRQVVDREWFGRAHKLFRVLTHQPLNY